MAFVGDDRLDGELLKALVRQVQHLSLIHISIPDGAYIDLTVELAMLDAAAQ